MVTPIEIVRLGIRYFVRLIGWSNVAKIVQDEYPRTTPSKESQAETEKQKKTHQESDS